MGAVVIFPPAPSSGPFRGLGPSGRLPELHLYEGSACNRSCDFCTVHGSPQGWYVPYCEALLRRVLELVEADGCVKFYGGEPTLQPDNTAQAMRFLRGHGFRGRFRIYSNGVRARALIALLESDDNVDCSLNHAILTGIGAPPLPPASLRLLEAWAAAHPARIFRGHAEILPVGRATDGAGGCARCAPVLTSRGALRGCPFAVEIEAPHFELEGVDEFLSFHAWQAAVLEPAAQARGLAPCALCNTGLADVSPPDVHRIKDVPLT